MPVSKTEIRTWLPLGKINANVVAKVQILHTEGRSRVDKTGVWWASVRHFSQGFAHILHVQVHPPCRQMTRVTDVHCWVAQPFLVTSPDLWMSNAKGGRQDCHGGVCNEKSHKFKRKKTPEVLLLYAWKKLRRQAGSLEYTSFNCAASRFCGFGLEGMHWEKMDR